MTSEEIQSIVMRAEDELDTLKDKAKETDELAKENLQLRIDYQQANDIIVEQQQEIERLKQMKLNTEKYASEMEDKYILEKNKNNKAIEYINRNCITSDVWKDLDFCNFVPIGKIKYKALSSKKVKELLDTLKGVDKE